MMGDVLRLFARGHSATLSTLMTLWMLRWNGNSCANDGLRDEHFRVIDACISASDGMRRS